jgi:hypothetical protein
MIFHAAIGTALILPLTAIGARPINAPAAAFYGNLKQPLGCGATGVVVEHSRSFIEPSRMPGIGKLEMLKVEMVAVFVAKRAEKCPERSNFFLYCSTHPYVILNRDGIYMCGCCSRENNSLIVHTYPGGAHRRDQFRNRDAEVVGRIVLIARRR